MEEKPKLLVAIRPKGRATLAEALEDDYALVFCHTLTDAQLLLDDATRAIVCGTNFDDSRMFDLLRLVKSDALTKDLPFICVKVFSSVLHDGTFAGVEKAAKLMGAAAYVDLAQWRVDVGKVDAAYKLCSTINTLISGPP